MTRDLFWFAAGLMAAVAGLLVAIPILRGQRSEANPPPRTGLWVAGAILAGMAAATVALYFWTGTPSAIGPSAGPAAGAGERQQPAVPQFPAGATAPSMEDATARLAARLAKEGGTPADWDLLAQSYDFLGRPEEAAAAREHARGSPAAAAQAGAAAGTARIAGSVELDPGIRDRAPAGATLFIYAREIGAAGPPLAVLRVTAEQWPVTFTLDDSNAMMPGRDLSHAGLVKLEARISRSGNALPQSGDLVGTIESLDPRAGKPVRIAIDHVF